MREWYGAAAVCVNEKNEVLMIKSYGSEAWAVPSGGIDSGETAAECCVREVMEETGYPVKIKRNLFTKQTVIQTIQVETTYFEVIRIGDSQGINDPDETIEQVAWMSRAALDTIEHMYPEDVLFLTEWLDGRENPHSTPKVQKACLELKNT